MLVEGGGYTIHLTQHHQHILCTPTKGNSPSPRLTVSGLRHIGSAMRSRPKKKKTASSSDASQALFAKHHLKCLRRFLVALSKSTSQHETWATLIYTPPFRSRVSGSSVSFTHLHHVSKWNCITHHRNLHCYQQQQHRKNRAYVESGSLDL